MKPYYEDGSVTIYHGDCREILPTLAVSPELVIVDPPYGVGIDYGSLFIDNSAYVTEIVTTVLPVLRTMGALVFVTPGVGNFWQYPRSDWALCWAKPGSSGRNGLGGFNEWEPVLVYGRRRIYNDFKYLVPPSRAILSPDAIGHPCPKPLKLMTWLVEIGSDDSHLVLDPLMGSGTALRAAKDLGRKAIGIEIEERYCEIAANRCRQEVLAL